MFWISSVTDVSKRFDGGVVQSIYGSLSLDKFISLAWRTVPCRSVCEYDLIEFMLVDFNLRPAVICYT
jgi:hypothetical protein